MHLIEAQALFVPALREVFGELGLEVGTVSSDVEMQSVLEGQPDVLFIDIDYVNQEPLQVVSILRTLAPNSAICVYTSKRGRRWARACQAAGADAIFSKNARRSEIVAGMNDVLGGSSYIDIRLEEGDDPFQIDR